MSTQTFKNDSTEFSFAYTNALMLNKKTGELIDMTTNTVLQTKVPLVQPHGDVTVTVADKFSVSSNKMYIAIVYNFEISKVMSTSSMYVYSFDTMTLLWSARHIKNGSVYFICNDKYVMFRSENKLFFADARMGILDYNNHIAYKQDDDKVYNIDDDKILVNNGGDMYSVVRIDNLCRHTVIANTFKCFSCNLTDDKVLFVPIADGDRSKVEIFNHDIINTVKYVKVPSRSVISIKPKGSMLFNITSCGDKIDVLKLDTVKGMYIPFAQVDKPKGLTFEDLQQSTYTSSTLNGVVIVQKDIVTYIPFVLGQSNDFEVVTEDTAWKQIIPDHVVSTLQTGVMYTLHWCMANEYTITSKNAASTSAFMISFKSNIYRTEGLVCKFTL